MRTCQPTGTRAKTQIQHTDKSVTTIPPKCHCYQINTILTKTNNLILCESKKTSLLLNIVIVTVILEHEITASFNCSKIPTRLSCCLPLLQDGGD